MGSVFARANEGMTIDNRVSFRDVSFSYRRGPLILREVSFDLPAGQSLAVVGGSGIGKSTLLKLVDGSLLPSSGQVIVCGQATNELTRRGRLALRREEMGLVFQTPRLIPELSVIENVMLPALLNKATKREAVNRAGDLIARFDIDPGLNVSTLSGGQACRVGVARALVTNPTLLVADEPTASLDSELAQTVVSLLLDYCRGEKSLLIVTHDQAVSRRCTRSVRLDVSPDSASGARLKELDVR